MEKEEEKKEPKAKTVEEKVMERQANNLLNFIVAKTYARHAKMTEEEFLKDIGFEGSGKTENEAFRIALMNMLIAISNKLIDTRQKIQNITQCFKMMLVDDGDKEESKENKKGNE